jgi:hypothetical protein
MLGKKLYGNYFIVSNLSSSFISVKPDLFKSLYDLSMLATIFTLLSGVLSLFYDRIFFYFIIFLPTIAFLAG